MSNKANNPSDHKKYPQLRQDLKISKMVNKQRTHYVIKDPIKNSYFRFKEDEYAIIDLFQGKHTLDELVLDYNIRYPQQEIDRQTIESYFEYLNSIHLLVKSAEEMNVMLVEKVKEMRQMQLLSKKGSLFYKRFPLIDPDKIFNKMIPYLTFFWSKAFFIFSILIMLLSVVIIFINFERFQLGLYELFNFSTLSFAHLLTLWVVIYLTIAIHELGHGLTCKYYGGEVHEIGFLLLFFQPCLYANVNDAWLFDKKWKQILVTLAGGYIEFFIGCLFTLVWAMTNPNSFINVLSLQIVTIASFSTIMFNFNPLMKLDGYYLLSDFLETPNLKEESAKYLSYYFKKHVLGLDEEEIHATQREKWIFLIYGGLSFMWSISMLLGMIAMLKMILVNQFYEYGMLAVGYIACKLFKSHVNETKEILLKIVLKHKELIKNPKVRKVSSVVFLGLGFLLLTPSHYLVRGECQILPAINYPLRSLNTGHVKKFYKMDGEVVHPGAKLVSIANSNVEHQERMTFFAKDKEWLKYRKTLATQPIFLEDSQQEWLKSIQLWNKAKHDENQLTLKYMPSANYPGDGVLNCTQQEKIVGKYLKKGEEICRIYPLNKLKTRIEISEAEILNFNLGHEVEYKLFSNPIKTYRGKIQTILPSGTTDKKNPSRKIYSAEIEIENDGSLRSGMSGVAKIYGNKMIFIKYLLLKLAYNLRMDLFF